jgi:hypothetical protein
MMDFSKINRTGYAQAFYPTTIDGPAPMVFCGPCAQEDSPLPKGMRWQIEEYAVEPNKWDTDALRCDGCHEVIGYREP